MNLQYQLKLGTRVPVLHALSADSHGNSMRFAPVAPLPALITSYPVSFCAFCAFAVQCLDLKVMTHP